MTTAQKLLYNGRKIKIQQYEERIAANLKKNEQLQKKADNLRRLNRLAEDIVIE